MSSPSTKSVVVPETPEEKLLDRKSRGARKRRLVQVEDVEENSSSSSASSVEDDSDTATKLNPIVKACLKGPKTRGGKAAEKSDWVSRRPVASAVPVETLKKKSGRGKIKKVTNSSDSDSDSDVVMTEAPARSPPKRTRKIKRAVTMSSDDEDDDDGVEKGNGDNTDDDNGDQKPPDITEMEVDDSAAASHRTAMVFDSEDSTDDNDGDNVQPSTSLADQLKELYPDHRISVIQSVASSASNLNHAIDLIENQPKTRGTDEGAASISAESSVMVLCVGNTAVAEKNPVNPDDPQRVHNWVTYVRPQDATHASLIASVTFKLHPSFEQAEVTRTEAPFEVAEMGWGEFDIQIVIVDATGASHEISHTLSFIDPLEMPNEHFERVVIGGIADGNDTDGVEVVQPKKETSEERQQRKARNKLAKKARHAQKKAEKQERKEAKRARHNASDDGGGSSLNSEEGYEAVDEELAATVLTMMNTGSLAEVAALPRCGPAKAKIIIKLRPFESWVHLLETLDNAPKISSTIAEGCLDIIREQRAVERVLNKCLTISEELKSDSIVESSEEFQQPTSLAADKTMRPFQKIGLRWLSLLHSRSVNMILADEMGLGKTIQSVAFLAHLKDTVGGLSCVIVPSSVQDNWLREFDAWCPSLRIGCLRGSVQERAVIRSNLKRNRHDYDVLLTTYNVACGKHDKGVFRHLDFSCVIFDEGHMLKNIKSERYQTLMRLNAKSRVLLTGTPLQNNLLELLSLLNFTMPKVFAGATTDLLSFFSRQGVVDQEKSDNRTSILQKAKSIMEPFVLRRKKAEVLLDLPAKIHKVEMCEMDADQSIAYKSLLIGLRAQQKGNIDNVNKEKEEKAAAKAIKKAINDIPKSERCAVNDDDDENANAVTSRTRNKTTARPTTKYTVDDTDDDDDDNNNADDTTTTDNTTTDTATTDDTTTAITKPAPIIIDTTNDNSNDAGKGEVQNVDTLSNVLVQARKLANHPLLHRIKYPDHKLREMANKIMNEEQYLEANEQYIFEDMTVMTDFELDRLCRQFPKTMAKFQLEDQKAQILRSGKLTRLQTMLKELENGGHRVLIFSQFTSMMNILEVFLNFEGHKFLRIDGSTAVGERQSLIDEYSNDPSILVFLLSTRAGGLGINLTAADTVIIHDIDYNPQQDKQAEDRSHRVGQTKPVTVYRMVSKDTVEQLMLKAANNKLELDKDISDKNAHSVDLAQLLKDSVNMVMKNR
eukprot:m.66311 g.66311  ORF g.66311 m.66311 type:complete len:1225 (-) comp23673_c0_seq2:82-3756(-)